MRTHTVRAALVALMVAVGAPSLPRAASPAVPRPTVVGPVTGGTHGKPYGALSAEELSQTKSVETEFFFSGSATAYERDGSWGVDGKWKARPASQADYKVRMLVRRPADAARFNGVVVIEWLNVTAQQEGAADYAQMKEELTREGYAWVGIGAQTVGVNAPRTGLKAWDAERYGSLVHPGDAYSYDIFSQAAQAVLDTGGANAPLSGLRVRYMLATGRSQSASRLITYINAVHPLTHLFNGYFVHSRGAGAPGVTPTEQSFRGDGAAAGPHIRTDIDAPVFDLETEGDMINSLRGHLARQDPGAHYRRWEVAGAAHVDSPRWVVEATPALDMGPGCKDPINAAPLHAVAKAGLRALTHWVREGVAPPQSPVIEVSDLTAADPVVRDRHGNAKGGIRLPEMEAPTARMDGLRNDVAGQGQSFCGLYGHTMPLGPDALASLYPTHEAFVKQFSRAADELERQGYWLKPEADQARKAAAESRIGR